MSDYFTDPYTRCPYRAGWCEKEADHEGSHYTTYRDGELWTMPAAAPAEGLREALAALVGATTHLGQYREVGQLDFCESSPHEGYCGAAMHALGRARAALARHESAGSE